MKLQLRITAASIALVSLLAVPSIAQKGYLKYTDPMRRYSIEFPTGWTWMIIEPATGPIATFVHPKKEAAIVVERFRMPIVLKPDEITDAFAEGESLELKENQPLAAVSEYKLETMNGRKVARLEYQRPGVVGEPGRIPDERVRQFSFPVNKILYRITCFSIVSAFPKYETTFQWVANSFVPGEELPR
jgi:hypothetical protein